jgi:hypothetical protein
MIDFINRGVGACGRLGGNLRFEAAAHLNPEQKQVVAFVFDSRDRTVNIRGAAGTVEELRFDPERGLPGSNRSVPCGK